MSHVTGNFRSEGFLRAAGDENPPADSPNSATNETTSLYCLAVILPRLRLNVSNASWQGPSVRPVSHEVASSFGAETATAL